MRRLAFATGAALLVVAFLALGIWQVQRRAWKLDLIERVEARVHAAPTALPPGPTWPAIDPARDEYRRVSAIGIFLHDQETLVQAATVRGAGFWVLTPLRLADGRSVLVNRGFVPPELRESGARGRHGGPPPGSPSESPVTVTGLLRLSEPGGGFLRRNDATGNRWFSRDVSALAAARGLAQAAPFFIDAEADASAPDRPPIGGLTVIRFANNHLVYALTWFALAAMTAAAALFVRRQSQRHDGPTELAERD